MSGTVTPFTPDALVADDQGLDRARVGGGLLDGQVDLHLRAYQVETAIRELQVGPQIDAQPQRIRGLDVVLIAVEIVAVATEGTRPDAIGLDRAEATGLHGLEVGKNVGVGIAVEEGWHERTPRPRSDIRLKVYADEGIDGIPVRRACEQDGDCRNQESGRKREITTWTPR